MTCHGMACPGLTWLSSKKPTTTQTVIIALFSNLIAKVCFMFFFSGQKCRQKPTTTNNIGLIFKSFFFGYFGCVCVCVSVMFSKVNTQHVAGCECKRQSRDVAAVYSCWKILFWKYILILFYFSLVCVCLVIWLCSQCWHGIEIQTHLKWLIATISDKW